MAVYEIKVYTAQGGRSSANNSSNSFVVQTALALTDETLDTKVRAWLDHLRPAFLASTYFMRAVISTLAHEGKAGHPEAFKTIELSGTGARPVDPNANQALPLDIAMGVKLSGGTGRAGLYLFRNSLNEVDVEGGGRDNFIITQGTADINNALALLISDNADFTLGLANRKTGAANSFRPAATFRVSGCVIKHHHIRRKKHTASSASSAQGLLVSTLPIITGAAAYFLTKNPAAFSAGERAGAIASASSIGEVIQSVIEHLTTVTT
jgi:hypothetical protein